MADEEKKSTEETSDEKKPAQKEKWSKKSKRQIVGFFSDFKAFISKGNIMNLAVAVVIGAAFTAIVNGLVSDIIGPIIALIPGQDGFSALEILLRDPKYAADGVTVLTAAVTMKLGDFLQKIINFLLVAFTVFIMVRLLMNAEKGINHLSRAQKKWLKQLKKHPELAAEAPAEVQAAAEPIKVETAEEILKDIRTLLTPPPAEKDA